MLMLTNAFCPATIATFGKSLRNAFLSIALNLYLVWVAANPTLVLLVGDDLVRALSWKRKLIDHQQTTCILQG
jgi:hypothetical protein